MNPDLDLIEMGSLGANRLNYMTQQYTVAKPSIQHNDYEGKAQN